MVHLEFSCAILFVLMDESFFCNHCHSMESPDYSLGKISAFFGFLFLIFGFVLGQFSGGAFLVCILLALSCFALSYGLRSFYCSACGSPDLIPMDSPKAQEFQYRRNAFEHVQGRLDQQPQIQPANDRNPWAAKPPYH